MNADAAYIYVLRESGCNEVRYVGQTTNPKSRKGQHCKQSPRWLGVASPRRTWLVDARSRGVSVDFEIIEECNITNVFERESFWIEHYRRQGHRITNTKPTECKRVVSGHITDLSAENIKRLIDQYLEEQP